MKCWSILILCTISILLCAAELAQASDQVSLPILPIEIWQQIFCTTLTTQIQDLRSNNWHEIKHIVKDINRIPYQVLREGMRCILHRRVQQIWEHTMPVQYEIESLAAKLGFQQLKYAQMNAHQMIFMHILRQAESWVGSNCVPVFRNRTYTAPYSFAQTTFFRLLTKTTIPFEKDEEKFEHVLKKYFQEWWKPEYLHYFDTVAFSYNDKIIQCDSLCAEDRQIYEALIDKYSQSNENSAPK